MEQNEQYTLMYRAPKRENHQSIVDVLDEIMNRLEKIEQTLTKLEKNS
tara:strand:+ start:111 stop:254 length:144 start_codon:yes stop_codon:yes gene_type:complete